MSPSQEYTGNYDAQHKSVQQLHDWHKKRIEIFQNDPETWYEVDYVAFETIPLIEEIGAVREALFSAEAGWDRKFWVSCVFPSEGESDVGGYKLPDGSSVEDVVVAMLGGGPETGRALPFGVGINCTKVGKLRKLVLEFEREIERAMEEGKVEMFGWPFLVIYPDGAQGLIYNTETHTWDSRSEGDGSDTVLWDEAVFEIVKEVKSRGKWRGLIVGGCCKVLPGDIGNLRARIDGL